ncbi:ABC transporter permease [Runella sp.]|uniref:ABC transporter permease n=1 Tax=Runella sp. TaxID=1960881 RepID=UPI003D0AFA07
MNQKPPRWATTLLGWWADPNTLEEVQGDLLELYTYWVQTVGVRKADWRYALSALKLLRPLAKRETYYPKTYIYSPNMIRNYFKIAFRNLLKHKGYSFINIFGLATGMAVAMLIGLWVWDELSFNKYHQNYDDIAQIRYSYLDQSTNTIRNSDAVPFPMGAALKSNYNQNFKHILMAWWLGDYTLSSGENKIISKGEFIEPEAIDMLSLKMLSGSNNSLYDPHSIILSKTKAEAIFGKENPINKALKIDNKINVKVTGVYEDLPQNSKFGEVKFFASWDLWVSTNDWMKSTIDDWGNSSYNVYVQKQPNISYSAANAAIKDVFYKVGTGVDKRFKKEAILYPMSQWHLYSEFKEGRPAGGLITFVWLFGIVGLFVLLLACINFMNLSTARSEKRGKEVGIRKAIGSAKGALIFQFLSESFLVVLLAFFLAILLVGLSISWFNELADKELSLPFSNPLFWLLNLTFITFTGFLAGLYPAFYLSSFQPIKVLKGTIRLGRFAAIPRKVLVIVQFAVSVVLIIGTIIVYQQIQYASNRPIGYNRDGLITLPMNDPNYKGKLDVIKSELLNTGMVAEMAMSSSTLTKINNNSSDFSWKGKDPDTEASFACMNVTHDFGKMVGWQFIAGRDFSKIFSTDSSGIIINETAAKYLNLKNPIGEFIKSRGGTYSLQIVGIIKDMIMDSPYEPAKRGIFFLDKNYTAASQIVIKIKPTVSATEALPKIEAVFKKIVPSASFDYKFVDKLYAKKFSQEQRIGKLATFFAILAIFISCLGLFGLASFVAEQRTKEIGVRKVLGASVANLWQLLSKDFVVLVIISCVIAAPIAYCFMNEWLQKYTYRTEISWWIFAVSGAGALMITLLTVSFQAIKAALMNPVKSLKTE